MTTQDSTPNKSSSDHERRVVPQRVAEMEAILAEIKALTSDVEAVRDTFEGATDAEGVIDLLLKLTGEDEAMIAAIEGHETQLGKRRARLKTRVAAGKALMFRVLKMGNGRKMERPLGTVSLDRKAASLGDLIESKIPATYWMEPAPVLDRQRLLADAKSAKSDGGEIPGVTLAPDAQILKIRRE